LGVGSWVLYLSTSRGEQFPAQLAGLIGAATGIVLGSLAPQLIRNSHGEHHRVEGVEEIESCPATSNM
jgi:hypothetical protein